MQGVVKVEEYLGVGGAGFGDGFQGNPGFSAPTFARITASRVIHQDLPHELRRHSKEMSAIAIVGLGLAYQPDIRFMYQSSGLQGMIRALPAEVAVRETPKFR